MRRFFGRVGFYSLIRMLPLANSPFRPLRTNNRVRLAQIVPGRADGGEFNDMLERIAHSRVCALDVGSTGYDRFR